MSELLDIRVMTAVDLYHLYLNREVNFGPCRGCMLMHPDGFRYAVVGTKSVRYDGEPKSVVAVEYGEDHLNEEAWGPWHEVRPDTLLPVAIFSHDHD